MTVDKQKAHLILPDMENIDLDVITDNMGNLRVEAGESMSDSEMLNGFDWCVEGVTVEE